MLKEKIEAYCNSIGLDRVGFIPCRKFEELRGYYEERQKRGVQNEFEAQEIEKRIDPSHYMPEAKTILSFAFPYYSETTPESDNGFSVYTKRLDYHRVVGHYLKQVAQLIETLGGQAVCLTDSNTLPERYIAYLAGIGFIGKNNMLITPQYGSYVFLGEILTDLVIECTEVNDYAAIRSYKQCGTCTRCLQACPTKSIHLGGCNPNICLSYLTQKKELTDQEMKLLKGNVFGCDFCQLKCPYNEEAEKSHLSAFEQLPYMNEPIETFAGMNNAFFKEKVSKTSCGWRGKNVIKRNALIHMWRKGQDITPYGGDSPYITGYIERLSRQK